MSRHSQNNPARLRIYFRILILSIIAAALTQTTVSSAQDPGSADRTSELLMIGGIEDERLRINQILGKRPTAGYLIRSTSIMAPPLFPEGSEAIHWSWLYPSVGVFWNSDIPFSLNDGSVWAGRGATVHVTGGIRARWGPVSLIFAPEAVYHQNQHFDILRNPDPRRSPFAAPWETRDFSIDLPTRFGSAPYVEVGMGQSSLSVRKGPIAVGAATENLWWGPGIRNAIVMSNNAAGFPHLFLRTTEPVELGPAVVEGMIVSGRLTESPVFDRDPRNDHRSLNAVAVALSPLGEPNLSVGITRAVYAPMKEPVDFFQPWLVVMDAGRTFDRPTRDLVHNPRQEEILSLFARWVFPSSGFESYAEWARHERPASLREFLVEPHHTQGYTLGLQWARTIAGPSIVRLQGEITNLEQSTTVLNRRVGSYFTSAAIPQGYTHLGQTIGAAIGPGASSQWIAADYFSSSWRLGTHIGRVRWNNDVFYVSGGADLLSHDVSLLGGIRGGFQLSRGWVDVEFTLMDRLNFLFRNDAMSLGQPGSHDIRNYSLRVKISPSEFTGTPPYP